jgi:predicted membrane protein
LAFNPLSKSALSNAANFTRLVREFSCFTLVPLFNIRTITGIYNDIAKTFNEEQKKYADRSELWDGIWGVSTKDVQKTNTAMELAIDSDNPEDINEEPEQDENNLDGGESKFKKFKHSKFFLRIVSILIYIGFILSLMSVVILAFFAFVALYIKTRHVGNFIRSQGNFIYKWFNFITFIMNIASLSQSSPAIKLIIYQLKVLTKKAHVNEYRRRRQNRIKENAKKFDADKDEPGIQPPKIIIHKKKISRTLDDSDVDVIKAQGTEEIDADKLSPPSLKRQNSKLSSKSTNSV